MIGFAWGLIPGTGYHGMGIVMSKSVRSYRRGRAATSRAAFESLEGRQLFAASTPFTGTPYAAPGTIQADDYDLGGPNAAYHTLTPVNQGGQYRTDQVSIENTTDAQVGTDPGGPFDVGHVQPGEWLNYTVNVAATGSYTVNTRVASQTGGAFHYNLDGAALTTSVTLPNTGGWQTWQTVASNSVGLTAGTHVLQLFVDSAAVAGQDVGNFHYITLTKNATGGTSTPFTGTPYNLPGTVQFDDYDLGGSGVAYNTLTPTNQGGQYRADKVSIENTTDVQVGTDPGGPFDVGHVQPGEWLNYTVNVTTAGSYVIGTRVASQTGGTFHYLLDGTALTGAITLPNTGGWQTWQTVPSAAVPLTAGTHVLRMVVDTAAVAGQDIGNFHYLTATLQAPRRPPPSPARPTRCPARSRWTTTTWAVRAWRTTRSRRRTRAANTARTR